MNEQEFKETIRKEFGAARSTPEIDLHLKAAYASLKTESRPMPGRTCRMAKVLGWCGGGLAAAFLLLVGVNAINPALAESLPLVGNVFQSVNRHSAQQVNPEVQKLAVTVEDITAEVPAGGDGETAMRAALQEYYYDGEYVYAGTLIECDSQADALTVVPGDTMNVTINGEEQILWGENGRENRAGFEPMFGNLFWYRDGAGCYMGTLVFRVPEKFRTGEPLEIGFSLKGICDLNKGAVVNSTPFSLSFTAEQNEAKRMSVLTDGVEVNGIKLVSAAATPGGTEVVVEYPDTYRNPSRGARLLDGRQIGGGAGTKVDLGNGTIRMTAIFYGRTDGLNQPVVYTVYGKNGDADVLAEFTLDFESRTAMATQHYSDPESPHFFGKDNSAHGGPEYACGEERLYELKEGFLLARVFVAENKGTTLEFATPEDYREVRAELYQDGELAGSTVSNQDWQSFYPNYIYWDYEGEKDKNVVLTDLNEYFLHIGCSDFMDGDELEIRLLDNVTGEVLVSQKIVLEALS